MVEVTGEPVALTAGYPAALTSLLVGVKTGELVGSDLGSIGFDVGRKVVPACWRLLLRLIKLDVLVANDNAFAAPALKAA